MSALPDRLPREVVRALLELAERSGRTGREWAASLCARDGRLFVGGACGGTECSVSPPSCPPGSAQVGDAHTHPDGCLAPSPGDLVAKMAANLEDPGRRIDCLSAPGERAVACVALRRRPTEGEVARAATWLLEAETPDDLLRAPVDWRMFEGRLYGPSGEALDEGSPEFREAARRMARDALAALEEDAVPVAEEVAEFRARREGRPPEQALREELEKLASFACQVVSVFGPRAKDECSREARRWVERHLRGRSGRETAR